MRTVLVSLAIAAALLMGGVSTYRSFFCPDPP
jgi:hypothetical protein